MPKAPKPADDHRTQRQKFIDAAHEHGADTDEDTLRRIVKGVAKAPADKPKKGPPKTRG